MKMTKRTVDKRTTNPAMRIVRAHYPGIGHAYSDKRSYGRRYKFSERRSSESAVNALNTLFRLNGVNAKAELHKGKANHWGYWMNHLVIKSYDTSPAKKAPSNKSAAKKWKVTTPAEIVNQVDNLVDSWSEQELKLLMKMAEEYKKLCSEPFLAPVQKQFSFTEFELKKYTQAILNDFMKNVMYPNVEEAITTINWELENQTSGVVNVVVDDDRRLAIEINSNSFINDMRGQFDESEILEVDIMSAVEEALEK